VALDLVMASSFQAALRGPLIALGDLGHRARLHPVASCTSL
jgi:hypothetical protein